MTLKLYNTLSREKAPFKPLDRANVRIYVCGPTVYDFAHIGNARPVIVFDVLYRLLRHIYGPEHVTYVRNITDVDDKINARAAQDHPELPLNEAIRKVTEKTEQQFHTDMAALGALPPNVQPRATEHIEEMKAMIERLVENGCAYVAEDHVLFHVAAMADYGKLSGRSLDEMIAGARVEVAPYKQDPMDFVLWKPSKPGEPSWPSPCGIAAPGRPGWHIECSAMAAAHLGETFDIHGGGIDLVFPHHENEIAQSRCSFHTPVMAQVWMHNGFLQVEGEKMAKSAGNFVTVHELLKDWHGQPWAGPVIRLAMLKTHYRQPLDWTLKRLEEARTEMAFLAFQSEKFASDAFEKYEAAWSDPIEVSTEFEGALLDDLNTPLAISQLLHRASSVSDENDQREVVRQIRLLGLFSGPQARFLTRTESFSGAGRASPAMVLDVSHLASNLAVAMANNDVSFADTLRTEIGAKRFELDTSSTGGIRLIYQGPTAAPNLESLKDARNAARAAKNFKEADRIRYELAAMGITLKDAKDPKTGELVTTWEVAR